MYVYMHISIYVYICIYKYIYINLYICFNNYFVLFWFSRFYAFSNGKSTIEAMCLAYFV